MTHGREKSDSSIVPKKPPNKAGRPAAVEGRGQGERGPAKHAPDAEPGTRVTGAGTRTRSRKAGWHTTVHRACPPCEHRSSPGVVPGTEAGRGADGVPWADDGAALESNLEDLHGRIHRGAYRAQPELWGHSIFFPKPFIRNMYCVPIIHEVIARIYREKLHAEEARRAVSKHGP